MTRPTRPLDLTRVVCLATALAAAHVAVATFAEGLAARGHVSLAVSLASTRFTSAFAVAFLTLLVARILVATGRARAAAILGAAVVAYAILALRWPSLRSAAPGWSGARALGGQALAIVGAGATAWALVHPRTRLVRRERLVVLAAALSWAAAVGVRVENRVSRRATPTQPNVILISLDGVRADRLGSAGSPGGLTPNLDAFALRALRFENAFTPAPSTLLAHASLLTGLSVAEHGASEGTAIDVDVPLLSERLRERGYDTIAQVGDTPWFDSKYGFTRGFDVWRAVSGGAGPSIEVLDPLLDGLEDRRFFLFLHFDDAAPDTRRYAFDADPEDLRVCVPVTGTDYLGCDPGGRCGARYLLARNEPGAPAPLPVDVRQIAGRYDAGVRSLDRRLGRLFRDLEARGLLEDSIVIVTADHGQAFREHDQFLHFDPWIESTHVPLIVRPPGGIGERSSAVAISTADVAPWIDEVTASARAGESATRLGQVLAGRAVPEVAVVSDAGRRGWAARTSRHSRLLIGESVSWLVVDRRSGEGAGERVTPGGATPIEVPDVLLSISPPVTPRRGPAVPPFDADRIRRLEWLGEPLGSPGQ